MRDTTAGLPGRPLRISENAGKGRREQREMNAGKKEEGINTTEPRSEGNAVCVWRGEEKHKNS